MNKVVSVVTGGSKGIGLAITKLLLDKDHFVYVGSRSLTDSLKALIKDKNVHYIPLDLASEDSIKSFSKELFAHTSYVSCLVNCAGTAIGSVFLMTRLKEMRETFDVNYFNTLYLTQLIAKKMIRKKVGTIVNIVSTAGLMGAPGTIAYGGSKASLIHATKVLATELGTFGIRVNAVAPAIVDTDMGNQNAQKTIEIMNDNSAIRGCICATDIAETVAFLCSENKARYITGQVFRVDRGLYL